MYDHNPEWTLFVDSMGGEATVCTVCGEDDASHGPELVVGREWGA